MARIHGTCLGAILALVGACKSQDALVSVCKNPSRTNGSGSSSAALHDTAGDQREMALADDSGSGSRTTSNGADVRQPVPASEAITFYDHVLPILSMQQEGYIYKCTVCHDQYRRPNEVRQDLDRIIASVTSRRMPTGGSPVRSFDVDVLRRWRDEANFALGDQQAAEQRQARERLEKAAREKAAADALKSGSSTSTSSSATNPCG